MSPIKGENDRKILKCTHKKVNAMFSPTHALKTNYCKWLVGLAAGLTLMFLGTLTWQSYLSYCDFQKFITTEESINNSNALIGQFDEALTMSARMAAATGDRQWEERYRLLEPQLDEEIQKVKRLAPDLATTKGVKKADETNQILVEMEYRSFRLTGEGRQDEARALLSSREYEEAKHIYASGLQQIRDVLSERTRFLLQVVRDRLAFTLTLLGTILPLLLVLWALIIRTVRNNSAKRLAAENALHESQNQYFNLVEGTPDLVTRVSADGRFLFLNHAALEIYGISPEECIGCLAFDFIHPEDREATEIAFQTWLKSGLEIFAYENRMLGKDGRMHHLAWSIRREHDKNGNISSFSSIGRDITERKRAADILQARLRLSEFSLTHSLDELLQKMLDEAELLTESVIGFFHLVDADQKTLLLQAWSTNTVEHMCTAEGKGQHYDINKAGVWADCLRERRPVIHNDYASLSHRKGLPPGHAPILRQLAVPVLRGEQITAILGVGNKATDYNDKDINVVSILADLIWDITERKRMEAEKAKLEEQNRRLQKSESLERMSGAIAHIFNNQLSVVQGYLQMVIGDLPPDDSRAVKLAKAMQAAMKASKVSGHLLFYLGQWQIKSEPLDLSELCRMSLPLLQAGKTESVALETDLPSPGPCINADAKQIQQILTNLMFNAREAIGDGAGTIRLTVKTVSQADIPALHRFPVDWRAKEQQYACLEVTDSGCGIKGKDMDNLFDPFFSTKFTGRGLGLSIVLGIVKTHDAVITVENGIGCGSVFKVFFLLSAQMAPRQTEQIDRVAKIVPGGTILLVEDEDALREMTRFTLVHFGFTVLQAKDGVEAVEIFKTHKDEVSCLLCDLTMPRMDGWETISAVRAIRHDLPVVLASGYDEGTVMAGNHNELPDFFLNKPYDINKLSDTIGRAIARRAVLESSIVRKCESSEV